MSYMDSAGHPLSGNLVLQHRDFKTKGFSLDYRFHKRCVRIVDFFGENGDLGSAKVDPASIGDLVLGLCWPEAQGKREMPMWSFGFPVVISTKGGGGGVATPGGPSAGADFGVNVIPGGVATGGRPGRGGGGGGGKMNMLPIADPKDSPDARMVPIPVEPRVLKAKGPENPPQPPPPPPGAGGRRVDPNRIDSGSETLYLGIGGSIGGFGGQGVGTGSSFPRFGGVRQNFSSGSSQAGATFGGVRNNFSNGNSQAGATFQDPTAGRGRR